MLIRWKHAAFLITLLALGGCTVSANRQSLDVNGQPAVIELVNNYSHLNMYADGKCEVLLNRDEGTRTIVYHIDPEDVRLLAAMETAILSATIKESLSQKPPGEFLQLKTYLRSGDTAAYLDLSKVAGPSAWECAIQQIRVVSCFQFAEAISNSIDGQVLIAKGMFREGAIRLDMAADIAFHWGQEARMNAPWEPEISLNFPYPSKDNPANRFNSWNMETRVAKLPEINEEWMVKVAQYRWTHFIGEHVTVNKLSWQREIYEVTVAPEIAYIWGFSNQRPK